MNKSLLPVGDKPAISRIIDTYPPETVFVVTLGYLGQPLRQFLEIAYPERHFIFVTVEKFDGPGSSLAYSMLCARDYLRVPFIYNAGDSIWQQNNIVSVDKDALAGAVNGDSNLYASFDAHATRVTRIHAKRMTDFDYVYIGIAKIHSYEKFWLRLERLCEENPGQTDLNDLSAFQGFLEEDTPVELMVAETWHDIGSVKGLLGAQDAFGSDLRTLGKVDEAVFKTEEKIFKFFSDPQLVAGRVKRAKLLKPHVPAIQDVTENWYSYNFVAGEPLSQTVTPALIGELLSWAQRSIWSKLSTEFDQDVFRESADVFYIQKTLERLNMFTEKTGIIDKLETINGVSVPSAGEMVSFVRESELFVLRPGLFHGDFVLGNIIESGGLFTAIDWRQGFGGLLDVGDVHYDLAKLNHSLTMDHALLNDGQFSVEFRADGVFVEITRRQLLVRCEEVIANFCLRNGYDLQTVNLLTPVIWINMAPLHPHPMDEFLYFYGRQALWARLKDLGMKPESFSRSPISPNSKKKIL